LFIASEFAPKKINHYLCTVVVVQKVAILTNHVLPGILPGFFVPEKIFFVIFFYKILQIKNKCLNLHYKTNENSINNLKQQQQ
jgi:hypothetical protein